MKKTTLIVLLMTMSLTTNIAFAQAKVKDIDGNTYTSVTIGSQVWLKENLATTKYNDGTPISLVTDNPKWGETTKPAYCYYNNETDNKAIYGLLYNGYTVDATFNENKNLCPIGWHVPSDIEWSTLTTYLDGESQAGGKMKEISLWKTPNTSATNSSGFSAKPGGERDSYGASYDIGSYGTWWSSTHAGSYYQWCIALNFDQSKSSRFNRTKSNGNSVRCICDTKK